MTKKFMLVIKDKLAALSKLALLPWLQIYHDNKLKKIEGHLQTP